MCAPYKYCAIFTILCKYSINRCELCVYIYEQMLPLLFYAFVGCAVAERKIFDMQWIRARAACGQILVIEHKSINASCFIFVTICAHPLWPKKIKFCEQTAVKKNRDIKTKRSFEGDRVVFFLLWICLRVTLFTQKPTHDGGGKEDFFFIYYWFA